MITIEIENPTELAAKESFWARAFGGLAPRLIQRKVEEKIVASLEEVFEDRGIRAKITIQQDSVSEGIDTWEL